MISLSDRSKVFRFSRAALCHLCGWIERIPGGTRQHDGLETGLRGGLRPSWARLQGVVHNLRSPFCRVVHAQVTATRHGRQ